MMEEEKQTSAAESIESTLPKYIQNLLSPGKHLDLHITVGDPETCTPEKIGVLKYMLIAHSEVFRAMLLESPMREETEFAITDIEPTTFKTFLMFLYRHDTTSTLSMENAIKLLYAAEKYDVQDLKDKLGKHMKSQLTINNVFLILENSVLCEKVGTLWEAVTEVIQYSTAGIFSNEQFVDVSEESLLIILQQDKLSVQEINIWKAAVKWATHKVQSRKEETVSAEALRTILLPCLKYIRLCTLSSEHLCKEVAPTQILTSEEIGLVCISLGKQEKTDNLLYVCNDIQIRGYASISSDKNIQNFTYKNYSFNKKSTSPFIIDD